MDNPLVGVPQLRARNCKWTNAACDLSPGRSGTTSETDIKRLDGAGKKTDRGFAGLRARCRIERMRVEGQQIKRDGINNEAFIKAGGTRHISHCTCRLLMRPLLLVVPRVCATPYHWKHPVPYWHYTYACILFSGNLVCILWRFSLNL